MSRWQKDVPGEMLGYVLGVLERIIKEGCTVQGAPDNATGQDFLRRTGNDSQRRKYGVRKSRYYKERRLHRRLSC